jgi:hypothetical protein
LGGWVFSEYFGFPSQFSFYEQVHIHELYTGKDIAPPPPFRFLSRAFAGVAVLSASQKPPVMFLRGPGTHWGPQHDCPVRAALTAVRSETLPPCILKETAQTGIFARNLLLKKVKLSL